MPYYIFDRKYLNMESFVLSVLNFIEIIACINLNIIQMARMDPVKAHCRSISEPYWMLPDELISCQVGMGQEV